VKKHKKLVMHYINSRSFSKTLGKLQTLFDKLSRRLLTKWLKKMENPNLEIKR
jgi:DNA-binding HxlR family transcriptional regulator